MCSKIRSNARRNIHLKMMVESRGLELLHAFLGKRIRVAGMIFEVEALVWQDAQWAVFRAIRLFVILTETGDSG